MSILVHLYEAICYACWNISRMLMFAVLFMVDRETYKVQSARYELESRRVRYGENRKGAIAAYGECCYECECLTVELSVMEYKVRDIYEEIIAKLPEELKHDGDPAERKELLRKRMTHHQRKTVMELDILTDKVRSRLMMKTDLSRFIQRIHLEIGFIDQSLTWLDEMSSLAHVFDGDWAVDMAARIARHEHDEKLPEATIATMPQDGDSV